MMQTGQMKRRIYFILQYLLLALLVAGYFAAREDSTFLNLDDALVVGPMICEKYDLSIDQDGFGLGFLSTDTEGHLYDIDDTTSERLNDGWTYLPYRSQVGLQGYVFSAIARMISARVVKISRWACMALLAFVLVGIAQQIYKRYNNICFAFCFLTVSAFSPYMGKFAGSLYWLPFTWFLPMLLSLLILNYEKMRVVLYPLLFLSAVIKCLCGYEYVSTIFMTSIMFYIVDWICNKEERKSLLKLIMINGVLCLLAFSAAMILHSYIYGKGDISLGFQSIWEDIVQRRTFGNAANYDVQYADSLNASILTVLKLYLWGSITAKCILLLSINSIFICIYQRCVLKKTCKFEVSLLIVSFVAAISWIVLAKAHSYVHTPFNPVLWYLGYMQINVYIYVRFLMKCGASILLNNADHSESMNERK